jgi:hypothetical protein
MDAKRNVAEVDGDIAQLLADARAGDPGIGAPAIRPMGSSQPRHGPQTRDPAFGCALLGPA